MLTFTRNKLLLACTLLCCQFLSYHSFAQDTIDNSFNSRMNYVFGRLEKNRVPNGLLRDYAFEMTSLEAFSGASVRTI